jgi:NCS1 family nucleobase:cation symporter-1
MEQGLANGQIVIGIIPNFYGFLNNMGVSAPIGVTHAYYFAYEIGLFLAFGVYWALNHFFPPVLSFPMSEWREPVDYLRPEDRGDALEGRDVSVGGGSEEVYEEKGVMTAVREDEPKSLD